MAVMLLGVLWMMWFTHVQGERQWENGILVRKEGQHEGFPFEIECPGSDVIKIRSTSYGVPNNQNAQLYRTLNRTDCYLPEAKEIVAKRCNNRTQCSFDITRDIFPDPCPGSSKYLEVSYNCVKFLFKCPGRLSGIGSPAVHNVHVFPEDGSWTRDPLMYPERVYFTTSASVLQEYWSMADFVNGNPKKTYDISPRMTPTSVVVYDRNLYYVKENSRHIIRFSLITRRRTKEYPVPPGRKKNKNTKISLHADETGLWITYDNKDGKLVINKLSQNNLTPQSSWVTNRRADQSSHIFMICGVMYSVSSATGLVDYSYDTKANQNREKFNLSIRIHDQHPRPFSRPRQRSKATFFSFNASYSSYNPRDRKLYLWDRTKHLAITMKLLFNSTAEDQNVNGSRRPADSTTSTTAVKLDVSNPTTTPKNPIRGKCHSIERKGMMWEEITAGDTARQECYDGTRGWATWKCVKLGWDGQAEWAKEGPSMPDCIDWINEIAANYHRDKADLLFTMESLQQETTQRFRDMTSKQLRVLIKFTKEILQNAFSVNQTSASQIVRITANGGKIRDCVFGSLTNYLYDRCVGLVMSRQRGFLRDITGPVAQPSPGWKLYAGSYWHY